ncbi:hypothetical protein [Gordonia otitidis]|uniref:Uncharacterized protein n=1 Tax=Gordonia otitidis (strain DSM 44809 / CCUG 52243 / JCM 12355 / NBRC 100426 / IFM 10032) TaxID=1108044 RepID=H5TI61_GORO1|nr:hypothetical protein [Gordonia otitidis]GAB33169.1 hypothetical protein GOOTI_047_00040 [Gordonia otitidis NBRC 100426]
MRSIDHAVTALHVDFSGLTAESHAEAVAKWHMAVDGMQQGSAAFDGNGDVGVARR